MPPLSIPARNGHTNNGTGNGEPVGLAKYLNRLGASRTNAEPGNSDTSPIPGEEEAQATDRTPGTDDVAIGSTAEADLSEVKCSTMADAANRISSVKYLLRGWIPFGMVTGIIGEPGMGKSAFALWLARTIITGAPWFNGMEGLGQHNRKILWCATENDMAITIDRMQKWKMPMDRILLPFEDPLTSVTLDAPHQLEHIEKLINLHKPLAVFVDSLRGGHDGDENSSRVGKILQNLAAIAERTNAAFPVVHHTGKLTDGEEIKANSSRGSNAIIAMFRSQIGIDKPDPKGKWCRVQMLKENLGLKPKPVGFKWADNGLVFGDAPTKPPPEKKDAGKKDQAEQWLAVRMTPGEWYEQHQIEAEATAAGLEFSTATMHRAKTALGIKSRKDGKGWKWQRPMPKDDSNESVG